MEDPQTQVEEIIDTQEIKSDTVESADESETEINESSELGFNTKNIQNF
jgi:hypothetical protein